MAEASAEAARLGVVTVPTTVFFGADGKVGHVAYGVVDTDTFRRRLAGLPRA